MVLMVKRQSQGLDTGTCLPQLLVVSPFHTGFMGFVQGWSEQGEGGKYWLAYFSASRFTSDPGSEFPTLALGAEWGPGNTPTRKLRTAKEVVWVRG